MFYLSDTTIHVIGKHRPSKQIWQYKYTKLSQENAESDVHFGNNSETR